jgi:histidinol-phosphate aminotransferase
MMSKFWSPQVRALTPYVPGEQPRVQNLIKLNTNENPYGPSPRVLAAIAAEAADSLRLYPDPDSSALKAAIAAYYGVTAAEVFVGNGSDEVLGHAFHTFFRQDAPIIFPEVTYSFYPVYCRLYGIAFETVPLAADMTVRADDYARPCGGVVIANPNAPTGIPLPLAAIERIVAGQPDRVVLVDEAYVDFGGDSAIGLVRKYPNLLVVQTFSKSRALAGLRVGFAIGGRELIAGLERVKNSFNSYPLGRPAAAGAVAAIGDEVYFQQMRVRVMDTRERLAGGLRALGFEVCPSAANFLFVRHPARDAKALAAALRERAILVRHFSQPGIENFLRISIGTDAECDALHAALAGICA